MINIINPILLFVTSVTSNSNKCLKIQSNNFSTTTKSTSIINSAKQISWSETLSLPISKSNKYKFQIATKHSFGYNPEQLEQVLVGQIVINPKDHQQTASVYNQNNQLVAYLQVTTNAFKNSPSKHDIASKISMPTPSTSISPKPSDHIEFKSIVAHVAKAKGKTCKFIFTHAPHNVSSDSIKSRMGEIVLFQKIILPLTNPTGTINIEIKDVEEQKIIGSCRIKYGNGETDKKGILVFDGVEIGDIYLETQILHPNKPFQKPVQTSPFRNNISHSLVSSKFLQQSQKKIHIMQSNKDIKFGKSQRFIDMSHKQNPNSSYLGHSTFEFKNKNEKFYRGASIGCGQRFNYSNKIPGVGDYQLPSIWDRY